MQLYVGSTEEFINDANLHSLGDRIGKNFYDYYGQRATFSLLQSWQNSLTAMALQIMSARLLDNGIVVEMELPLTSKRLDCMLFGRDTDGNPNGYLVELKQWSQVKPSDVDDCVLTYLGGSEVVELHPSLQALNYAEFLDDANDAYGEGGIKIHPSSYLHNMMPGAAKALRTQHFEELLRRSPMFIGADAVQFADAMRGAIGRGDGETVMRAALAGKNRPSRRLLEHTAKMVEGESRYTLLDEQLIAYKSVMAEVRRGRRSKQDHAVVVIKGGPGTGKSVIALNLVGDLSRMQVDVRHATGSKAFTETLWSVIGKKSLPQFRYFNNFRHAEEGGIDVLVGQGRRGSSRVCLHCSRLRVRLRRCNLRKGSRDPRRRLGGTDAAVSGPADQAKIEYPIPGLREERLSRLDDPWDEGLLCNLPRRGDAGVCPRPTGLEIGTPCQLDPPRLSYYHCSNMRASLQRVGNSQGIIIPKPILAQVGFERDVDIEVEAGAVVIRKPKGHVRQGWAAASRALAASGDDALLWPEFQNDADQELAW